MKFKMFKSFGESARRVVKVYKDVWLSRINYAIGMLVAMRHAYGKMHEGEAGVAIAKFVHETFRSIGIVNRVRKLSNTRLGKAFIAYTLVDVVRKIDESKVSVVMDELKKLKDKNGLEFFEGVKNIVVKCFDNDIRRRVDRAVGIRISNAIVSETAIYDPISERMVSIDPLTGRVSVVKMKLNRKGAVEELFSRGVFDKSKDIFSTYAEWRMLKIVDEALAKGLKGKDLGYYVFNRLRDELYKDDRFFYAFRYYLAKHIERLEKSQQVGAAFGELLMWISRMYRRLAANVIRAASSIPIFGPLAESVAGLGEGIAELGEGIGESIKKSRKGVKEIKISLGRKDDLIGFF